MRPVLPLLVLGLSQVPGLAASVAAREIDYNRDVRPILSENCFSCHGFDEKGRKGKLRLDEPESAYAERNGVTRIKPGDPANSEVWLRITSTEPDEVMPPPEAHATLTAAQKETLKAWIEQGAKYAPHWSLVPPRRPAVPAAGSGAVHPIDAFVRAPLGDQKLAPAPEADRATLIRRLAYDLTGLPPAAEEVAAFVGDRAPEAYDRLVDRLLASPHFGERLALEWLDAARYADTNGFSIDGGRHMWLWRDWVIQAFNDNLPYDRFLVEQLAGDLLPNRTDAQLIASGFQRNNMVTHEGGTIPEENLLNYNADRVKTLGEAVLGLTLACAQCHDHKFDPITQKDYYRLYAFFNTVSDKGLDGNAGVNPLPSLRTRTVLRSPEGPQLRAEIAALEAKLAQADAAVLAAWEKREQAQLATRGRGLALHPVKVLKVSTPNRGVGFAPEDGNRVRIGTGFAMAAFDVLTELPRLERPITGIRAVFHPQPELPGGGWGYGPSSMVRGARVPAKSAKAAKAAGAVAAAADGPAKGSFMLTALAVTADVVPGDQVNLHRLQAIARVTATSWQPANPPAGALDPRNESGWAPDLATTGPVAFTATFAEPVRSDATPYLTVQLNFGNNREQVPGLFELQVLTGTDDGTDLPPEIVAALAVPPGERSAEVRAKLWSYCAAHAPELRAERVALANLKERLAVLTEPFTTMVMDVAAQPRETFILNRGDYSQPTDKVDAGVPQALPPLPAGATADRLGLAQWTVMPDHPLTARVAVNRFWKMLFGTGLVATAADFGAQGEWPSHPELLDWLAVEFVASGWDVKALLRQIVRSQTYRQSSVASADALERDPQNRLLARGPRFRLPAEFIRDTALQVSGLLVPRLGGPSVNPYTPGDLWREISHYGSSPATAQTFVQDHGEKLYRRSLYTYWKRTAPPPNLAAFDAPNREVCTVSRANTTTPLQALVLLNDVQFVEAARALAERALQRPGDDPARLRWAFTACVSREPQAKEIEVLTGTLARERGRYAKDPAAAEAYLRSGESPRDPRIAPVEHAAWAQVASLLLNLSETITRN
jgi:hypothetical protein